MEKGIITNRELQETISAKLKSVDEQKDASNARVYFVGARTLLTAVKIDIETARQSGLPLYKRTKQFLEIE